MSYRYIDDSVLRKIWMIRHNSTIINEIVGLYREGLNEILAKIEEGLRNQDWKIVSNWLHRLQGSSANVGAIKVCKLAKQIEKIMEQEGLDSGLLLIDRFKLHFNTTIPNTLAELDRLRDELHQKHV